MVSRIKDKIKDLFFRDKYDERMTLTLEDIKEKYPWIKNKPFILKIVDRRPGDQE